MVKNYKALFLTILFLGTALAASSSSWMGIWMGLEINLLSMIPLIGKESNPAYSEASIKYFVVQALASTLLLMSLILLSNPIAQPFPLMSLMVNSSMFIKMGAAPFHFWFPEVMEGLSWLNSLLLLTWQKIAPMVITAYSQCPFAFTSSVIIISMLVSGLMGMNQTSLRKIMAFSSINHIGWMLGAIMIAETLWFYYFVIYTAISITVILMLRETNMFQLKQMVLAMGNQSMKKLVLLLNFLSLGGLPPFLGFLPKWLVIQALSVSNLLVLAVLMTVMTLIPLYIYLRVALSSMLFSAQENNYMTGGASSSKILMAVSLIALSSLMACTLVFNYQ